MTGSLQPQLLSASEAARFLGISTRLLWTQSRGPEPIPTIRIGRRVLYPLDKLRAWIEAQETRR